MDIIQGIIIGIVQGLTEFLPVSSSAHLVFIQNILGVESSLAFDTFLHLGSLLAVLWFFRADIIKMIVSWISSLSDIVHGRFKEGFHEDPYKRLAWYVILATIPVGLVGVFFEDSVDALFSGALYVPAFFLFVTGTILYLSQRMTSGNAGLVIGLDKEFAAKFSFILSIPAILGAFLLQVKDIGSAMDANFLPIILGFIAAFIAGYAAIKWMLELIQKRSLDIFAYYCWAVGIIVFMGSIAHIF